MKLTPGSRWKSAVCDAEVVVIKAPKELGTLACGGLPMLAAGVERPTTSGPLEGHNGGSLLGKRYGDAQQGIEVLCTRGGQGSLTFAERPLAVIPTRRLPASD
jgi:hypothetical protein